MNVTQASTDKIDIVRRGFDAFAKHDMETLRGLFGPASTWYSDSPGVLNGKYEGADAILAFFATIGAETKGTFRSVPVSYAANGDRVFVEAHVTGERNGKSMDCAEVLVFRFDGTSIRDVRVFLSDPNGTQTEFWR